MKAKVKKPYFDNKGLHRVGDVVDVKTIDPNFMDEVKENVNESKKRPTVKRK